MTKLKRVVPLKRVVLKQEYYQLLHSTEQALMLQQFLYWHKINHFYDKLIAEEIERYERDGATIVQTLLTEGWTYKKAEDLIKECMLDIAISTCRRHLKSLVEKGYLYQRKNPNHKWDKTLQYRVNFVKLVEDLDRIGYSLEGFKIEFENDDCE